MIWPLPECGSTREREKREETCSCRRNGETLPGRLPYTACLALPTRLAAQSTTGTIQGTVTDEQEAVVPGAAVTIRNTATNGVRRGDSEKNGFYRFLNGPVGEYKLTIERGGFAKYLRSGITLSLDQDKRGLVLLQRAWLRDGQTLGRGCFRPACWQRW